MTVTAADVENGIWWENRTGNRAVSQWVSGDTWMLLGEEQPARHGGTCRTAQSFELRKNGSKTGEKWWDVLMSHKDLVEMLNEHGWQRIRDPRIPPDYVEFNLGLKSRPSAVFKNLG